jgi:hypothetical protein
MAPMAAVAACLLAAPALAGATTPRRAGAGVIDRLDARAASVRSYWTPARMRAAEPATVLAPRARGVSARRRPASRAAASRGGRERARLATRVEHVERHPKRTHGKVFFSAGLYDYQCSGTAVKAPSRGLVFTAGHCAYGTGLVGGANEVHRWEFVPAYDGGRRPFGEWPATLLAAPARWVDSAPVFDPITGEIDGGDSRYDVGAATVAATGGRSLQGVVGGARAGFDRPRRHRYLAFGYPATGAFTGGREYSCSSGYAGSDRSFGSPAPIRIRCDMTAGASGGGWMDPRGRLVAVTSYTYSGDSTNLYGPYFGAAIHAFYDAVKNG